VNLTYIDWLIMLVYFGFVLGIGFALKRYMRTSNDFFLAGRSIPAWVCGLAFISANLGAQEVIGMGASGAKYGIVDQPLLLDRRHPGDVLRGHLYDAVLLRVEGAVGAGVSAHALR
jgi:ABC-type dipeptide/oligopeptide/nickel transport system permease component